MEDVQHTLRMRLFNAARTDIEEPLVKGALKALGTTAPEVTHIERAVARVNELYFPLMRRERVSARALEKFEQAMEEFRALKTQILKSDKKELQDLVAWTDRELAEQAHCLDVHAGKVKPPQRIVPKPAKALTAAERKALEESRSARAAVLYDAYIESLSAAKGIERGPLWRINDYFAHDDPLWERLVDVMDRRGHLPERELQNAVQGVLGEAFALRHKVVVEIIQEQFNRAKRIVAELGGKEAGWEVKVVDSYVLAGAAKSKSLGELYDGSIWIVNLKQIGPNGQPLASPVFVLSVKSGKSVEAALQNTAESFREFGQTLVFPGARGAAGTKPFEIKNLQQLLAEKGITKVAGSSEGLSTRRLLVAPIPPSEGRAAKDLGKHVTVEFMPSTLSKSEMNNCSRGLTRELKRSVKRARTARAW